MSDQDPERDPSPEEEDPRKLRRSDQLPEEQPEEVAEDDDEDYEDYEDEDA